MANNLLEVISLGLGYSEKAWDAYKPTEKRDLAYVDHKPMI